MMILQQDSARLGQVAPIYKALEKSLADMCPEQIASPAFRPEAPYSHEGDEPVENPGGVFAY